MWEEGLTWKEHEGTCQDDGNALILYRDFVTQEYIFSQAYQMKHL